MVVESTIAGSLHFQQQLVLLIQVQWTDLKYLSKKIAHYLHDFHRHWFASFGLPPLNGSHKQFHGSDIRQLLRRVQHWHGYLGGGSGNDRAEIQVYSRLDIGQKDFFAINLSAAGPQAFQVSMCMDFVFFIPPPPFYEGTRAEFEASLDSCWYGARGAAFQHRHEDSPEGQGRQVHAQRMLLRHDRLSV